MHHPLEHKLNVIKTRQYRVKGVFITTQGKKTGQEHLKTALKNPPRSKEERRETNVTALLSPTCLEFLKKAGESAKKPPKA